MRMTRIRKTVALILAVVTALSCAAASAGTVDARFTVDRKALMGELQGFGLTEGQLETTNVALSLVEILNIRMVTSEDGAQVDLNLEDENAVSFRFGKNGQGAVLASTLFPHYALTMEQETMDRIVKAIREKIPFAGQETKPAEGDGSVTDILPASVKAYVDGFAEALNGAVIRGEPVRGTYEIEGTVFDTMTPITLDVPAFKKAFLSRTDDLLSNEELISSVQDTVRDYGFNLNIDKIGEAIDNAIRHFPESATATLYSNSDGSPAFYAAGQAAHAGKQEASCEFSLLCRDPKTYAGVYRDYDLGIDVAAALKDGNALAEYTRDGTTYRLDYGCERGEPTVYRCSLRRKPDMLLAGVTVTVSDDGGSPQPVETDGLNLMSLEDAINGRADAKGLSKDIKVNGVLPLATMILFASPEAASILLKRLVEN